MNIKQGQLAHLDGNRQNNRERNIAYLCFNHHDWLDTRPSQSKALTAREVHHFRTELQEALISLTGHVCMFITKPEGSQKNFLTLTTCKT
jgi:hypothetical protein